MPNNYFQFKQFTIHQNDAAMKVGTDGVLLGAWATVANAANILDVGTGTGLLALMAAQRNRQAWIDAVDIDAVSCRQAVENAQISSWNNRIHVVCSAFQQYVAECTARYDVILSNPPYFNNSLLSPNAARSVARHTNSLPYADLINGAKTLLTSKGILAVILPVAEAHLFIGQATDKGLYCSRILNVKPCPNQAPIRMLLELTSEVTKIDEQELCIDTGKRHEYSEEYKALTREFYLKF